MDNLWGGRFNKSMEKIVEESTRPSHMIRDCTLTTSREALPMSPCWQSKKL